MILCARLFILILVLLLLLLLQLYVLSQLHINSMDYEIFNCGRLNINLIGIAMNLLKYHDFSDNNFLIYANNIIKFPLMVCHPIQLMFPMNKYT